MTITIIILGYSNSKKHIYFEENFEFSFSQDFINGYYPEDSDFLDISLDTFFIKSDLDKYKNIKFLRKHDLSVWFSGVSCSMYKPTTDIYYQNADILIAFGLRNTKINKYVKQMKRVYCPDAYCVFPDQLENNNPNNTNNNTNIEIAKLIEPLVKKNNFCVQNEFKIFFYFLINLKNNNNPINQELEICTDIVLHESEKKKEIDVFSYANLANSLNYNNLSQAIVSGANASVNIGAQVGYSVGSTALYSAQIAGNAAKIAAKLAVQAAIQTTVSSTVFLAKTTIDAFKNSIKSNPEDFSN